MSKEKDNSEIEMFVAGLVLDPASNAPIVVLKDVDGDTCLPIWIGLAEATAIASSLKKVELARPMTHDLLKNLVDELGGRVVRVVINELQENTFISNIEVVVGDVIKTIDARPSDAIALAVRTDAQIVVAAQVLDQAQVTLVSVNTGEDGEEEFGIAGPDGETEETNFANIDKEKWEEILAEMDPDDFKYKM
jgi:bifunctional DNase/RNase